MLSSSVLLPKPDYILLEESLYLSFLMNIILALGLKELVGEEAQGFSIQFVHLDLIPLFSEWSQCLDLA